MNVGGVLLLRFIGGLEHSAEAQAAFETAFAGMDEKLDYRRLVEAKLTALGAAPAASGAAQ